MGAQLLCRAGDSQALKGCIAAAAAGNSVTVAASADAPYSPLGTPSVRLQTAAGGCIHEANAVASFLAGASSGLQPAGGSPQIDRWLEFEAVVLRPALYQRKPAAALEQLEAALSSSNYLAGSSLSLADVVVYCTLLPWQQQQQQLPPALTSFMQRVAAAEAVQAGTQQLLGKQQLSAVVGPFEVDAAAYCAAQPKAPIPGQKNILITSALPYVNNVPHLGNIIGCVLSADCYARYCRSRGYNTIFICGTDEYGTATETKALEEGLSCAEICDKYHAIHKGIYSWFGISFDKFGRTPTRAQTEICQDMFRSLWENGNIVEQSMEQLYSEALGKFLADRFVVGTCPKCRYEDARGDQCDSCGALMNPTELINPKCKISGTTPVIRSTKHLFLDLPKLSPALQQYIDTSSQKGGWSANCVQVTAAWMRDGLKQRCITRDLKWGIPVPLEGYQDKVFYVWFDAPIGYISITANYTPAWRDWWQAAPGEVELVQFMGKDNVPFHTVIFPATLLGSGQTWTMMTNISVTEYLNYEGGKFSKSRGTGVFGNDAQDTGISVEVWRYYLLANRPEQQDTDFKWSDLQARNNNELLKNLGNFVNRGLTFVVKFFEGKVPAPSSKGLEQVAELGALVSAKVSEYIACMDRMKLRDGIRLAMAISADGNKFITDTEPFKVVKVDPEHAATLVAAGLGLVRLLAALIEPYMPTLTHKILAQLNLPSSAAQLTDDLVAACATPHLLVPAGHQIDTPSPLITDIKDDVIASLKARFSGNQADRTTAAAAAAAAGGSSSSSSSAAPAAGKGKGGGAGKQAAAAAGGAAGGEAAAGSKKAKANKQPAAQQAAA